MRWIALLAVCMCCGCAKLQTLTVQVTVSPTLHLDGLGRGVDVQARVIPGK